MKRKRQRGFTMVELIVSFTIMGLLTSMAVPLAAYKVKRDKERELRYALREIRKAIDSYKDASTLGKIDVKLGTEGYPESLEILVKGVKLSQSADGKTIKFLRRIPMDPMTGTYEWGLRSMQDDPKSQSWAGRMFSMFIPRARSEHAMVRLTQSGTDSRNRTRRGYTLIELIIVMAIISILIAIAVPLYQRSILGAKESLLKNNIYTLRTTLDEYTYDKKKAPQQLQDLVTAGYLRAVPVDPITGNDQWITIMEDALTAVDQTEPGIWDVRSRSDQKSLAGTPYSEW